MCSHCVPKHTIIHIYIRDERNKTTTTQKIWCAQTDECNRIGTEKRFILHFEESLQKIAVRAVRRSDSNAYIECKTFENMGTTTKTTRPPSSTIHESVYENDDSENNSPDVKSLTAVILA